MLRTKESPREIGLKTSNIPDKLLVSFSQLWLRADADDQGDADHDKERYCDCKGECEEDSN